MMNDDKKKKLQAQGFKIGSVAEFLDLTPEEQSLINNVIIRHGKPIGICDCKSKGKQSCMGNGWVRDGTGYQKCPYFKENE
jgi:hypothetical protein